MKVTIRKAEGGRLDVFVKRTRREEVKVRPEMGIPQDQLGEALAQMVDKTRAGRPLRRPAE